MVRRRLPRISLGTVYRNLEVLSESGVIRKLELGGSVKRFDGNPANHYHLRCIHCDRLVDTPADIDVSVDPDLEKATDFKITGHKLELIGICRDCLHQEKSGQMERQEDLRRHDGTASGKKEGAGY